MKKKVSDLIVDFLIQKGVSDVFGYPGGMVTHLLDSFAKKEKQIRVHLNYHEQASVFCACGYAQAGERVGVAYATSGPGATNLITGICNAYFDSIPLLLITGQVNTFESGMGMQIRQRGFQETDIVSMTKGITKYSTYVANAENIAYELEKAWCLANEGRKGPVLLDIPMDIFRTVIETDNLKIYINEEKDIYIENLDSAIKLIEKAKKPVFLLGAGAREETQEVLEKLISTYRIPVVTSMLAIDLMKFDNQYNYGFIGAYGTRTANFIVAKSDLVIAIGSRMDVRQVGGAREEFAPEAKLIRVDIDKNELSYKVKKDELQITCSAVFFMKTLLKHTNALNDYKEWIEKCNIIKDELRQYDYEMPNRIINRISKLIPEDTVITTDVGQNQVWVAQSFDIKKGQRVFTSGGHGAMGYSLPAAIGAYYASNKPVICFNGDGGIQMNIQELQFLAREQIPVTVIILNNKSLGMIRHFQEKYFEKVYYMTVAGKGYTVPDFSKLAKGYGLNYTKIEDEDDIMGVDWNYDLPQIVEVMLEDKTYVYPKLEYGKPNQDQEPLLDRKKYEYLMEL